MSAEVNKCLNIYNLLFGESEKLRKQIASKYEEAISCQRNDNR